MFEAKIALFQKTIEEGKTLLTRLETKAEQLLKEKNEINEKFKVLGVRPESVAAEVTKLKNETEILIAEMDVLSWDLKTIIDSWR